MSFDASNFLKVARPAIPKLPRSRLLSVSAAMNALFELSDGRAQLVEIYDALNQFYDGDWMLYDGGFSGIPEPIDGNPHIKNDGYNSRVDTICELFNLRAWEDQDVEINLTGYKTSFDNLLIENDVAFVLARKIWGFFFPKLELSELKFEETLKGISGLTRTAPTSILKPTSDGGAEVDPSDLPPELDAAMLAFRAVSKGFGDANATFRNRLIEYLHTTYPTFKTEQVQRIATVANADPTPGRKKRDAE